MPRSSVFACFVCPHTDEILLVHQRGGKWSLPGGRCFPGEHPMSALRREVEEETHYALPERARPSRRWLIARPWRKGGRQARVFLFRHRPEVAARSEIDRVHWFTLATLPGDVSRTVIEAVKRFLLLRLAHEPAAARRAGHRLEAAGAACTTAAAAQTST